MSASSSRGASGRRTGAKLTVAVAVTVCATAGAATAATSTNKIRVSAPKRVEQKHQFKVKASGFAKASSEVSLVVADESCAKSWLAEVKKAMTYERGDSYFVAGPTGKSPVSNPYFVKGSFKVSATAHAGSKTGKQDVCAYLIPKFHSRTLAHDATTFRVTR